MKKLSFVLLFIPALVFLFAQSPEIIIKSPPTVEQAKVDIYTPPEPVIEVKEPITGSLPNLPIDTPGQAKIDDYSGSLEISVTPQVVDRNEPKEEFPSGTPVEYNPQVYNPNEPKEQAFSTSSGQERWDPDAYEDDDTAATAHYLSMTSTLQSENHTIEDVGTDIDWYYFYGIPGRTYYFYSTSSLDLAINLYQDNGTTQIDWDDDDGDGNNFYLEFTPTAQAYYRLKVWAYYTYTGPYTFWFKTGAYVDSWEIDDTAATAGPIFPAVTLTTYNHTIHNATDVDWLSFTGYTGRIYTFYSTGYTDVRIYLYASDGVTQLDFDDDDGEGNNFYLQFTLAANGTHYLKVEPYQGNAGAYAINFLYGANADGYEPDDGLNDFTSIEANNAYPQEQTHTLHTTTDQDWFHFIALTARTYHFWSTGNEDVRVGIYDSQSNPPLVTDDNSGEGNNFDVAFATPGATWGYEVKVDGAGGAVGTYTIHWRHDTYGDAYEADDSASDPTLLSITSTDNVQNHNLDNWQDEDWYRFYGIKGLNYTFYSEDGEYNSDPMDNLVYLYQDDGSTLISFNDDGGTGNNFMLLYAPPTTGYYKLKVVGYNGCTEDYDFHYYYTALADAYETDDSATDYTVLYPTTAEQTQDHTLHTNTDQDWFRFEAIAGRLYNFWSTLASDNQIYLYQDNGTTQIQWDDDGGEGLNFSLSFNCTTTGYYKLKVVGYSGAICAYQIHYSYAAVPDSYEPDNSSSQYTNLYVISSEQSQNHTLHSTTDEDWFLFQAEATKRYMFYSTGAEDTQIYLYQSNGTTLITMDDDNGDGLNFNLQYVFPASGAYLLKVIGYYGACGAYTFKYIKGAQPDAYEDDDSATDYTSLTVTSTLQSQSHTLQDAIDEDWFRFQGVAGRNYVFQSTGYTDTQVYLYQDNGTTLISSDDDSNGYPNFKLQYQPTTTAYYKLKVIAYPGDAGPYTFNYYYTLMPAPANLTITQSGSNILLAWNAVTGATTYKIYHSDNPYTGFTQLGTTSNTSLMIVSPPAKRFYRVTANN
jgi:hypothetical protein